MTDNAVARIAFVGAGNHASGSLYPNIAHIPELELIAVCDLDRGKAEANAKRFGAPAAYDDLVAMLDAEHPDGVCICGPPEMHHDVGLECLGRGIPVFMEKPPALDLRGTLELVQAAEKNGTFGMVGFMKRFAQANRVAKEAIDSGRLGPVSSITLIHGAGPYNEVRRMLLFNGIHMIDLGRFLAGDVASLYAYADATPAGCQAVSAAFALRKGGVGQLNMNSGHTWSDAFEQVYVSGAEAGLVIDASRATEVMLPGARFAEGEGMHLFGWSQRYYVSGNLSAWWSHGLYTKGYWGELSHFARAVLGLVEPTATLPDAAETMRVIEAIMLSIQTKQAVTVADVT